MRFLTLPKSISKQQKKSKTNVESPCVPSVEPRYIIVPVPILIVVPIAVPSPSPSPFQNSVVPK